MVASLGNASVNVIARTVLFEQSLKRSLKRMSLATAAIFAGVGAISFFGAAIKDAASLELRIARITTLMEGATEAQIAAFNAKNIRNFSNEIGISADKVAESIYYMIGSGVALKDAYAAVRAASNVAVATNTDLKFSSDFVSTALNAMGGEVDKLTGQILDSTHATDIFFAALAEGKGEPRELAQFISTAIPAAKGLGISYGEVNAAMAAGTLLGTKARKVTTGLSYIMRGLGNDTKGVGKVFKEISGGSFQEFIDKGGTLQEAIKKLGTEVGLGKISNIGGAETGLEAIKLLLTVWPQYVAIQKEVAGASGDADVAVAKVNKTLSRQFDIFKNKFKNFRGSVGDWMGPVLYDGLQAIQKFGKAVGPSLKANLTDAWKNALVALAPLIRAFGTLVDNLKQPLSDLWAAVKKAVGPIVDLAGEFAKIALMFVGGAVLGILGLVQVLGPPLLDALEKSVGALGALAQQLIDNKEYVYVLTAALSIALIPMIGVLVTAIGTTLVAAFHRLAWAALGAWLAVTAPISLTIAAVAAIGIALVYLWKKFETAREIIKGAMIVVATVVGETVKAIISLFKSLINAWVLVPDWLGGGDDGWAQAAVNKMQSMMDGIDGLIQKIYDIPTAATTEINIDATQAFRTIEAYRASMAGIGIFMPGQGSDTGFSIALDPGGKGQAAWDKQQAEAVGGMLRGTGGRTTSSGGEDFTGGGYNPGGGGAGDEAKKAASEAAKKLKAALKRVVSDINRIAKSTSKQSLDTIKENFKTLYADLGEAGKKGLIPFYKKQEKQLVSLAKKRDNLVKKYKGENKTLDEMRDIVKDLKDEHDDFAQSVKANFVSMGNLTGLNTINFTGMRNGLRLAVRDAKLFSTAIKDLQKRGLNATGLKQLLEAGPEGGLKAARALLRGGKNAIAETNKYQGELDKLGASLGDSTADKFFNSGIRIAEGLVKGLEKNEAVILKAMDKIGDAMVAGMKKKLGIKSPSLVFGEVGENISKGLAQGILDKGALAQKAADRVSSGITFGPGAVQVNGVSDPEAARRAGILAGSGVAKVLQQRRASAELSGLI